MRTFVFPFVTFVCLAVLASTAFAQRLPVQGEVVPVNTIRLEVFIRSDSEISKQAAQYVRDLQARTNGLEVVVHDVLTDGQQRSRLWKLSSRSGREKPVVPAF